MSALSDRDKLRTAALRYGPPRPSVAATGVRYDIPAAERAARIAAEDAARAAAGRLPQAVLNHLGTSLVFRNRSAPPLDDFQTGNHAPEGRSPSRSSLAGKLPRD